MPKPKRRRRSRRTRRSTSTTSSRRPGGLLEAKDLKLSRLLNAPPEPYTRERFQHTYEWTRDWGLVPAGATYENTVDNRAWR